MHKLTTCFFPISFEAVPWKRHCELVYAPSRCSHWTSANSELKINFRQPGLAGCEPSCPWVRTQNYSLLKQGQDVQMQQMLLTLKHPWLCMLVQVPISKFYIILFTQRKWDASCKEGFVGLDVKSLTWILAMLKTDSKCLSHR